MKQCWQGRCQSSGHHSKLGLEVPALHCPVYVIMVMLIIDPMQQEGDHNSPLLQPANDKLY